MKYRDGIFEFFGDLSSSPLFVFCKLRHVLLPEFGELILRVWRQKMARIQTDSEREKCSSRDSSTLSEVTGRMSPSADPGTVEKFGAAEKKHGDAS